jgi:hypothetical protein
MFRHRFLFARWLHNFDLSVENLMVASDGIAPCGSYRTNEVPRSKIYVNESVTKRYHFDKLVTGNHFFLVMPSGSLYTDTAVASCQGAYSCFNCTKSIEGRIYFYPQEYSTRNEFYCNPLPHCRPECARRTVQDINNNYDLLSLFFLMYGGDVVCAPSRTLLYLPGAMDLDQYHASVDDKLVLVCETPHVRSFMSPVYVSCSPLQDHQLVPNSIATIQEMIMDDKTTIAVPRKSDCADMTDENELAAPDPFNTKMSHIFELDPSCKEAGSTRSVCDG